MATRHFHITKHEKGWQLKEQKADRAQFTAPTKEEAVKKAAAWANKTATVKDAISIKIHGVDGKVKDERTYPRAADPKGSKG